MSSAASGWLMTTLDPSPLIVALVQAAASAPVFLLAIPAGALSDIVDRRRFLVVGELFIMAASILFAVLVTRRLITPTGLLLMTFIVSVGTAMTAPAWGAVVPMLVPKADLAQGIALNSAGVNVSRAVGPALGGLLVGVLGIAAPFWVDAFSNAGVIGGLLSWTPPPRERTHLPPERFGSAIHARVRERRRDGAYEWGLFEDPAQDGRFVETFLTDSWLEHLRTHERVTKADRMLEQIVWRFMVDGPPKTTHLIGVRPR